MQKKIYFNRDLACYLAEVNKKPCDPEEVKALRIRVPKETRAWALRILEESFESLRSTGKGLLPKTAMASHMDYCKLKGTDSLEKRRHNILVYRYLMKNPSEDLGHLSWKEIAHIFHVSKETAMIDAREAMKECMLGIYGIPFLPESDSWESSLKSIIEYIPLLVTPWYTILEATKEPGIIWEPIKASDMAAKGRNSLFRAYIDYANDGGEPHAERFRDGISSFLQNTGSVSPATYYHDKQKWIADLSLICRFVTGEVKIRIEGGGLAVDYQKPGEPPIFSNTKEGETFEEAGQ